MENNELELHYQAMWDSRHNAILAAEGLLRWNTPDRGPISPMEFIPFIEGDGIGPDIWAASVNVFDAAVEKAYNGERKINWIEVLAGQKAYDTVSEWLPKKTLDTFDEHGVGIKGPLTIFYNGSMSSSRGTKFLIDILSEFKDDKSIDRATLMSILEEVFRAALKRKFGSDDNFDIIINPDKGDLEIWRNRVVVADGEVEEPNEEIALAQARNIEPDFEIGEDVSEEVKLIDLGRRAILALRQNLISKIYEHDSTNIFKHFKDLEGDIYSAEVHHIKNNAVILLDDEGNELVLPKSEQIKADYFRKGEAVRGIIKSVELRGNKPVIMMSRTAPEFLTKLFEQEIPEVFDGLITIEGVARVPGEKAKIAVDSYDDRIDPVGACVGMKGSRIHGIVRELGNENIDVINFTKNTQLFIARALSPAKVASMEIHEAEEGKKPRVDVYLRPEEVSKAIGRGGVNIRLASQLTGFEIDVQREGSDEDVELTEFSDEIDAWVISELGKIGLDTAKDVLGVDAAELVKRTDLEEETVVEVQRILREEFED